MGEHDGRLAAADDLEQALLGGPRRYTRAEVAARTGVDLAQAQRLWRGLGFAAVEDGSVAFTDADCAALAGLRELIAAGLVDDATALAVTRAIAQAMSRLAETQVAVIAASDTSPEHQRAPAAPDARSALAREVVPRMEGLLTYVWRRHLAAASTRLLGDDASVAGDDRRLAVGFADLTGYTGLVRRTDRAEWEQVLDRFDELAADGIAERGGRVVKSLGDAVLFVADDAAAAASTALDLVESAARDERLPPLHVGLAWGPVLVRLGDVFGPVVNTASRLTDVARPGAVLVDPEMAAAVRGDGRLVVRPLRSRPLPGLRRVRPFVVRRAPDDVERGPRQRLP